MRIINLQPAPVTELPFLNSGRGPGEFYEDSLPVQIAWVDQLPLGVAAIVVTGDLQGREHFQFHSSDSPRLLGEWLPAVLKKSILPKLGLPNGKIGALLAGDFYTVPNLDRRGGTGLVTSVWEAFGQNFSWVVGVAGNHDLFGDDPMKKPQFRHPLHFLDRSHVTIDGLEIAGISGIVGNPRKPWRKTEEDFENFIQSVCCNEPDVLLMHDGPDVPELRYRGTPRIREALTGLSNTLVIRGHAHWESALFEFSNGLQVLNVDARVVVLAAQA